MDKPQGTIEIESTTARAWRAVEEAHATFGRADHQLDVAVAGLIQNTDDALVAYETARAVRNRRAVDLAHAVGLLLRATEVITQDTPRNPL